jgi:hypothetical protein
MREDLSPAGWAIKYIGKEKARRAMQRSTLEEQVELAHRKLFLTPEEEERLASLPEDSEPSDAAKMLMGNFGV